VNGRFRDPEVPGEWGRFCEPHWQGRPVFEVWGKESLSLTVFPVFLGGQTLLQLFGGLIHERWNGIFASTRFVGGGIGVHGPSRPGQGSGCRQIPALKAPLAVGGRFSATSQGFRSPFFFGPPPRIASEGQFHGKRALPGVASRGQPFQRQIEIETPPKGGIGRGILPSRLSERQSPDLDSHALRDTIFCCLPDQHLWRASERSGPGRRNCGKPARGPRRGGGGRVVAGRGILKSQDHGVCRVEVACQLWHIEAFGVNPQLICKRRMR